MNLLRNAQVVARNRGPTRLLKRENREYRAVHVSVVCKKSLLKMVLYKHHKHHLIMENSKYDTGVGSQTGGIGSYRPTKGP